MYKPKYFSLKELIPQTFYNTNYKKYKGKLWYILFDERLLMTIDNIREKFGKMIVNDWVYGGNSNYRGYRPLKCSVGATLSQHRFGRACDLIPQDLHPDEIRDHIIANQNREPWKHIGGLEMNISWLHIDTRARDITGAIQLFYP